MFASLPFKLLIYLFIYLDIYLFIFMYLLTDLDEMWHSCRIYSGTHSPKSCGRSRGNSYYLDV